MSKADWAPFFEVSDEEGDEHATRDEVEQALRLAAKAGSPTRAASLVGIAKGTYFRILRSEKVQRGSLDRFRSRVAEAERLAEPIRREQLLRQCGLEAKGLSKVEHAELSRTLGDSEAAQLARELGLADDKPKPQAAPSLADRMLARVPPENRAYVSNMLERAAKKKKEKTK